MRELAKALKRKCQPTIKLSASNSSHSKSIRCSDPSDDQKHLGEQINEDWHRLAIHMARRVRHCHTTTAYITAVALAKVRRIIDEGTGAPVMAVTGAPRLQMIDGRSWTFNGRRFKWLPVDAMLDVQVRQRLSQLGREDEDKKRRRWDPFG